MNIPSYLIENDELLELNKRLCAVLDHPDSHPETEEETALRREFEREIAKRGLIAV